MPDGSVKHVRDVAHAERYRSGELEFVGAVMDVTERKRTEEALRRSESYWRKHRRSVTREAGLGSAPPVR
jgi:PAS domain-containing protein